MPNAYSKNTELPAPIWYEASKYVTASSSFVKAKEFEMLKDSWLYLVVTVVLVPAKDSLVSVTVTRL